MDQLFTLSTLWSLMRYRGETFSTSKSKLRRLVPADVLARFLRPD
jgi:hypothetical protein